MENQMQNAKKNAPTLSFKLSKPQKIQNKLVEEEIIIPFLFSGPESVAVTVARGGCCWLALPCARGGEENRTEIRVAASAAGLPCLLVQPRMWGGDEEDTQAWWSVHEDGSLPCRRRSLVRGVSKEHCLEAVAAERGEEVRMDRCLTAAAAAAAA
ncbi:unnamed protein product [Sphenostylis stenocarpa]|uniref:Uncharacterized protein n=1 Tax=Sphenostylis stenocarpa TaxID=92480 RepID=A0AA86VFE5_9FABA|nr:unnamed protein product [Sphenostylis stenocarpa]